MKYEKPEMIELVGANSFGACTGNGSGDNSNCSNNGNTASDICVRR